MALHKLTLTYETDMHCYRLLLKVNLPPQQLCIWQGSSAMPTHHMYSQRLVGVPLTPPTTPRQLP